eukprot:2825466-Rhodomonas_salina.1
MLPYALSGTQLRISPYALSGAVSGPELAVRGCWQVRARGLWCMPTRRVTCMPTRRVTCPKPTAALAQSSARF